MKKRRKAEELIIEQAKPEDLIIVNGIIKQLFEFTGYYGEYTKLSIELDYQEYVTLRKDTSYLVNKSLMFGFVIEKKYIVSLIKSFEMLEKRYLLSVG